MTEQQETEVELTVEQQYLKDVLAKYNANPADESLSKAEQLLLGRVGAVEKEANELMKEFVKLDGEVKNSQDKMGQLNQQILLKRGQSQGLVESLLTLREEPAAKEA